MPLQFIKFSRSAPPKPGGPSEGPLDPHHQPGAYSGCELLESPPLCRQSSIRPVHHDLAIKTTGAPDKGPDPKSPGRLVAAIMMMPELGQSRPFQTSSWLRVCSPLIVASAQSGAPVASYRIQLVDKHYTRSVFLSGIKQIPYPGSPTPTNISLK